MRRDMLLRDWIVIAISCVLGLMIGGVAARAEGKDASGPKDSDSDGVYRQYEPRARLSKILRGYEGVWLPSGRLVIQRDQPDGVSLANAFSSNYSLFWPVPAGACDSDKECEQETEKLCKDAGHGGVKKGTVIRTIEANGSVICSGDCDNNGAVALVFCGAPG